MKSRDLKTRPDPKPAFTPQPEASEPATAIPPTGDLRDQIEREAYLAWEKDGREEGREQHYWFEAEKKLRGQGNPAYPTLAEREEIVKTAEADKTKVRKIPAEDIARHERIGELLGES